MALDRINATALLDGGVTTADIADDAVTTAKLATQTGNVDFADGGRIRLGGSQDLQIYHNGNNSYIDDTGTGNLYIRASDTVRLQSATGEQGVIVTTDGAVTLYHDNGAKLATAATGVGVTGSLTASGISVGEASITGTSTFGTSSGDTRFNFDGPNQYRAVFKSSGTIGGQIGAGGADDLRFSNAAGGTVVTIKDGNVGIGATPEDTFVQKKTLRLSSTASLIAGGAYYPYPYYVANNLYYDSSDNLKYIASSGGALLDVNAHLGGKFKFYTAPSGTAGASATITERVRIDSSGNLLVGVTSSITTGSEGIELRGDYGYIKTARNDTGSSGHLLFYNPNGNIGSITTTGTTTQYNTSSDYRLKDNVTSDWEATTRLKQLNPVRFNFITNTDTTVDGFLAHEVQDIIPEAITGEKDGMRDEEYEVTPAVEATYDDDGNILTEEVPAVMGTRSVPNYQGIDQSKLVPLLVKSLQEALDKIDTLETRLEALENA
jgi:hypothetical protein